MGRMGTTVGRLLTAVFCFSVAVSQQQMVDPHDMLGESRLKNWDEPPSPSGSKLLPPERAAESLMPGRPSTGSGLKGSCPKPVNTEGFFLRRFVRMLLKQLHFESGGGEQLYELTVLLSQQHFDALQYFAKADEGLDGIQEASSALEYIITTVEPRTKNQAVLKWLATYHPYLAFGTQVLCCIAASICTMFYTVKSWNRFHWKFLLIISMALFLISIPWTWVHLYKKNLAERMQRSDMEKPKECDPDKISFVTALFYSNEEKCAKYYADLLVDPLWEVKPTEALAETVVEFVWKPLGKMGGPLGTFLNEVTANVPWYMRPVVLVGGLLSLGFFAIVIFGYSIRITPWIVFEPRTPSCQHVIPANAGDHAQIRALRDALEQMRESVSQLAIQSAGIEEIKACVLKRGTVLSPPAVGYAEQLGRQLECGDGVKGRCEVNTIGCASIAAADTLVKGPCELQHT